MCVGLQETQLRGYERQMVFGFGKKKNKPITGTQVHDTQKAIMGSMFAVNMIALIDGEISPSERESLVQLSSMGGRVPPEEVLNHIESTHELLTSIDPMAWGGVFDQLKPFHKIDRSFIMHAAGSMAIVDQELHENEEHLLVGMAQWIGMSKNEFMNWCSEFQDRLNEAKQNGHTIITPRNGIFVS